MGRAVTVAWLALMSIFNVACSQKICTGVVIECRNYSAQNCESIAGCTATSGCAIVDIQGLHALCSKNLTAASCSGPKCVWQGGACVDSCSQITDSNTCNITQGDRDANGSLVWSCRWTDCTGTPKKSYCSDYSVDMCPAGCAVQASCPLGDC